MRRGRVECPNPSDKDAPLYTVCNRQTTNGAIRYSCPTGASQTGIARTTVGHLSTESNKMAALYWVQSHHSRFDVHTGTSDRQAFEDQRRCRNSRLSVARGKSGVRSRPMLFTSPVWMETDWSLPVLIASDPGRNGGMFLVCRSALRYLECLAPGGVDTAVGEVDMLSYPIILPVSDLI
jgi:hypothetical protein